MSSLQWLADTINGITKHGWSLSALLISLTALFRVRKVRKKLGKIFPALADDDSEIKEYVTNQHIIMENQRLMMEHLGVKGWDADSQTGKTAQNVTTGQQRKSLSQQAVYAHVILAKYFTPLKVTYHSLQRRMKMKSKLLSRKFLMAVISAALVIANDGLNLGLDQNTIIAFGSIVVGYIAVEGVTDIAKKPPEVSQYDAKTLDTVRKDSEDTGYTASN